MSKAIASPFILGISNDEEEKKKRFAYLQSSNNDYIETNDLIQYDNSPRDDDSSSKTEGPEELKRSVYQSLSGFKPTNQRWYENNNQKDNFNYVKDDYETDILINDCLKSHRFNDFVENIKHSDREGYGYHISDQPTNSGISQSWYDGYKKQNPSLYQEYPDSVKDLTQEQVDNLYCQGFYKPNHIETINDDFTAEHIFDIDVNIGETQGAPIIQNAINDVIDDKISTIGGIGTETITAINNLNDEMLRRLNEEIVRRRKKYYDSLNNKRYPGWYSRANSFRR